MGTQNKINGGLSDFEKQLSTLAPAEALDRGVLMFRAGQAAGTRTRRRWQMLTAAAVCLAAGATMLNLVRPGTRVAERIVYVRQAPLPPAPRPPAAVADWGPVEPSWERGAVSEFSYFRLRRLVLEQGLTALPSSHVCSGASQDNRQLMDELLRGDKGNG